MSKNLGLLLVCSQPYMRHIDVEGEHFSEENEILFNSISNVYIPLLNLFNKLEADGIDFKISMVIPPVLSTLLTDSLVHRQYVSYLEAKIELGNREVQRLSADSSNPDAEKLLQNAKKSLAKTEEDRFSFVEKYNQNLVAEFSKFAKKGNIELLATAGTDAYLPHFSDMPEIVNAQVETGIFSFRKTFNEFPDGFYLPYLAYQKGFDKVLKSYNMRYTILDAKSLLFSDSEITKGAFYPHRFCDSTLSFLTKDFESNEEIERFLSNPVYRDTTRDIGFDIPAADLTPFIPEGAARTQTGYKYWSKGGQPYDEALALKQAEMDARIFLKNKNERLSKASEILKDEVSILTVIPLDLLAHTWYEGVDFIENVIRLNAVDFDLELDTCKDLIAKQFKMDRIEPFACSWEGTGSGENLLDGSNSWMLRYSRKMCRRMVDISGRFPDETGLKVRLLNLGARELLISMSASWAKMLQCENFSDYASKAFKEAIKAFTIMYESLGSNTVSTEWLTNIEKNHPIFPWMNFRIFSPKV